MREEGHLKSTSSERRDLRVQPGNRRLKTSVPFGGGYNPLSLVILKRKEARAETVSCDSWSVSRSPPAFLTRPLFPPGVAVALKQARTPEFRLYQRQVVANCRALAATLMELGYKVVTGTSRNSAGQPPSTPGWGRGGGGAPAVWGGT